MKHCIHGGTTLVTEPTSYFSIAIKFYLHRTFIVLHYCFTQKLILKGKILSIRGNQFQDSIKTFANIEIYL